MTASDINSLGALGISRRQLHFILIVDCSGSMGGDKIASLNHAMAAAIPAMREAAADNAETQVMVRVLRFGNGADWHVPEAVPVDQLVWTDLSAEGETHMGTALLLAAAVLNPENMPGRQLPPVIVLVSDGQPTDDFAGGLAALLASPYGKKSVRIAVAIGSDADTDVLDAFIAHPEFKVLHAHNAQELTNRIRWATTAPVKTASSPLTMDGGPVAELAREAVSQASPVGDLVW
jgi:uncharacterized protein YegL